MGKTNAVVVTQINNCEVCGNKVLADVLDLGAHPMCDDLVKVGTERKCTFYPIEIVYCDQCHTAHQKFQIPKKVLFSEDYHYRSRFTADVLSGMDDLVASAEMSVGGLKEKVVVDIGCNDGSLLEKFRSSGAVTIGVEPTGASNDASGKADLIVNDYFNDKIAKSIVDKYGKPDLIVFTNVFAHIEDLGSLIKALNLMIGSGTFVIIENHYLGRVLDTCQFDTFYHEHPRTYSLTSFVSVSKALKLHLSKAEFPSRYGGNIRVVLSNNPATAKDIEGFKQVFEIERMFPEKFNILSKNLELWRKNKKQQILNLSAEHGPLLAKAFPGRAAILVHLLKLNNKHILKVFEKPGSPKIGHLLPGTDIPIASDDEFFGLEQKPRVVLNMAWHIRDEIKSYMKNNGFDGDMVDIISASDF